MDPTGVRNSIETPHSSELLVRLAKEEDRTFVLTLFTTTLTPYYDGDHAAQARRILSTHLAGGEDSTADFSVRQTLFILVAGGERVGLINMVTKKQGTCKISPIIVVPRYRGMGYGTRLLDEAVSFARKNGARQLYCTVPEKNVETLGFFHAQGFVEAGKSFGHYKEGMAETMLYLPLGGSALANPSEAVEVTIHPFSSKFDGLVRNMVCALLEPSFCGIDQRWLDRMIAALSRLETKDVDQRYKMLFIVTDAKGGVVGFIAASPKKGGAVKVMPLVALSHGVYEAIVKALPRLLSGWGRQAYLHVVPDSWEVACLQSHGWRLDGLLPDAYRERVVTQQWAKDLPR